MAQITAYRRDSGAKVRIPEHWLDHKVLGAPYSRTRPAPKPAPQHTPAPTGGASKKEA